MSLYDKTITIFNKVDADKNIVPADIWYKTVINNAYFRKKPVYSINGSDYIMSNTITVLIPFNDRYTQPVSFNPPDTFTMSVGDYIFLGDIKEEFTNIKKLYNKYKETACLVTDVIELEPRGVNRVQLKAVGV